MRAKELYAQRHQDERKRLHEIVHSSEFQELLTYAMAAYVESQPAAVDNAIRLAGAREFVATLENMGEAAARPALPNKSLNRIG